MAPRRRPITSATRSMPSFQGSAKFAPTRVRGDCSPCCPTLPRPAGDSRRRRSSSRSSPAGSSSEIGEINRGIIAAPHPLRPSRPRRRRAPDADPSSASSMRQWRPARSGPPRPASSPGRTGCRRRPTGATTISFDVPEGWWEWFPGNVLEDFEGVFADSSAAGGSGWGAMFMTVGEVSRSPCDPSGRCSSRRVSIRRRSSRQRWRRGQGSRRRPPCRSRSTAPRGSWSSSPRRKGSSSAPMARPSCGRPNSGPSSIPTRWSMRDGLLRPAQFRIVDVDGHLVVVRTTDFPGPSTYEVSQGLDPDSPLHAADRSSCATSSTRSGSAILSHRSVEPATRMTPGTAPGVRSARILGARAGLIG